MSHAWVLFVMCCVLSHGVLACSGDVAKASARRWTIAVPMEFYAEPCSHASLRFELLDREGDRVASFAPPLSQFRRLRSEPRPTVVWSLVIESGSYDLVLEVRDCQGNARSLPALPLCVRPSEGERRIFVDPHVGSNDFDIDLVETCVTYEDAERIRVEVNDGMIRLSNRTGVSWHPCPDSSEPIEVHARVEGVDVIVGELDWSLPNGRLGDRDLLVDPTQARWLIELGKAEDLHLRFKIQPSRSSLLDTGWNRRSQPFRKVPCCDEVRVEVHHETLTAGRGETPDDLHAGGQLDRIRFTKTKTRMRQLDRILWEAAQATRLPPTPEGPESARRFVARLPEAPRGDVLRDAWGTNFWIWSNGADYVILSAGSDQSWGRDYSKIFVEGLTFADLRTSLRRRGEGDDYSADLVFLLENVWRFRGSGAVPPT